MDDNAIDITLYNGAIRNSENEHMAKVLRQKSNILVAYGSCAHMGGIPGLANLSTKESIFERVYHSSETTVNPEGIIPQTTLEVEEGTLTLPELFDKVKALDQVVEVDYYIPGCPPSSERLLEVFTAIVSGSQLPPKGTVIGAPGKAALR